MTHLATVNERLYRAVCAACRYFRCTLCFRRIWCHQIHTNIVYRFSMQSLSDLTALLERLISAIPALNLDGDDLEEYSTVLLRLQNQVETGEPSERIVKECLAYLEQFKSRAA